MKGSIGENLGKGEHRKERRAKGGGGEHLDKEI